MICEMCGKTAERTKPIFIEGTQLRVCSECARFGESAEGAKPGQGRRGAAAPSRAMVAERLEARERRMRTRDVYQEETTVDLAPDYPQRIREARMARDWKQEELAAKINEKASIVAKLENGSIRPNDQLIKKLERTLNIKLMEKVALIKPESAGGGAKALTLGDLIKRK